MEKPREIAARLLARPKGSGFIEEQLEEALRKSAMQPADRRLLQELVCGVTRWRRTLDWLIERKTKGHAQKPVVMVLLRLGLYQLFWLDRIPDHAAVNETVELARVMGVAQHAGFINALLRGYTREKEEISKQLAELKQSKLALGYSHPDWLVERWVSRYGEEDTRKLLEWNNTPAPTFARINTLRVTHEKLLQQWRNENVDYDFVLRDWLEENLVFELKSHPPLSAMRSFQQGGFYVQDPSTLLAVELLAPKPGERVLDACAAPGGKTTFIAQRMKNSGKIVALDRGAHRLERLQENLKRLGVSCVTVVDVSAPPGVELVLPFDRALVDVPCSNTGVLRRRLELRWRITPEEIKRLTVEQADRLREAARHVKSGGRLVYSTCSLEPEENRQVVDAFLAEHPEWVLDEEQALLPFKDRVDGAYAAVLLRR